MSSTRLPGKTLADIDGEPSLALLIRRLQCAQEVERIVVATSSQQSDDPIEQLASSLGCGVYRGALDDVLGRFIGATNGHPGPVVRLTGDCPLLDPEIVDETVRLFERTPGCAYASNIEPRTFPDGLDTEVISRETLLWADEQTKDLAAREHVTTMIRQNLSSLRSAVLKCDEELGDLHWTVDTQDDLDFVRAVVSRLGARRHSARLGEILGAVRAQPSLAGFGGRRG